MPIKSLTECANMAEELRMSSVACGAQPDRVSPTHAGRVSFNILACDNVPPALSSSYLSLTDENCSLLIPLPIF